MEMAAARHPMPPEIAALSLEDIAERYIGRFRDKVARSSMVVESKAYKLCPLPLLVPVGQVSQAQSCRQDAHPAGPTRQHSHLYPHY